MAWSPRGEAMVRAAASGTELLIDVNAQVGSLFAAEVVRAVLNARIDPGGYDAHEVARVDEAVLVALSRPPGPVTLDAWRTSESFAHGHRGEGGGGPAPMPIQAELWSYTVAVSSP